METSNFLAKDREELEQILTTIAGKIYEKVFEKGYVLTQNDSTKDTLYGYVYNDEYLEPTELEIKGLRATADGLYICCDNHMINYNMIDLIDTFNKPLPNDVWHLIYNAKTFELHASETCNVYMTILSISEEIYQYLN